MGRQRAGARERNQPISESGTRDSDEVGEVAALARFSLSLLTAGSVSDQRAANDGVMDGVKKRRRTTTILPFPLIPNLSRSLRKIGTGGPWFSSRWWQLSAVSGQSVHRSNETWAKERSGGWGERSGGGAGRVGSWGRPFFWINGSCPFAESPARGGRF